MASSSAVSAVSGSQGGVLREAGRGDRFGRRYGRGVRFELHGGVFLVWSVPACWAGWRLVPGAFLSRGPFAPSSPFGENRRAADPGWGSAALKAPA